ncbi:hydantoinase B/oxoprolinase family protein [Martelella sp. HB161492]|uniref:hydantoinase B/oxoprolinase family protein n=1 Tax=Martelella sp. HB161492 TaxID=2720726 RepID=UPI001590A9F2|nr:hydantoinase B/oxoprolinase family protein [Martelella sp. HB161492]
MNFDPVLLEILNNKVSSVTEEVGFTIRRIGHSLFVKEIADFGTALATPDGKFFAYPSAIGVANFIDLDCGPSVAAVGALKPGDVIITNHPYASEGLATHTPDINIIVPYFHGDQLVCLGWSFLHISDVSGKVPGSISPSSTELFQEGILIPPVKLVEGGKMNEAVLALLQSNTRTPQDNIGDLKAMLAAHRFGEERVNQIIAQHGLETFIACQNALMDYAGEKARDVMRAFPNGIYEFSDYIDDDLLTAIPMRIRVKMELTDGEIVFDFEDTDPQTGASFNMVTAGRRHAYLTGGLLMMVLTRDPTIPRNAGIFKYIRARLPEGSLVNPVFPASVGVRHLIAMRCKDVVHGALAKADPQSVPAAAAGIIIPLVFAEPPSEKDAAVLVLELMVGGLGAGEGLDGVDGRGATLANMVNNPIEIIEDSAAVHIVEFSLRRNSGGAGQYRGGNGLVLTFEALKDGCQVLGRGMDRFRFQPWGLNGGAPGAGAVNIVNLGRPDERRMGKIDVVTLAKGDTFTVMTPGGGGFGDPLMRDPQAVLADLNLGAIDAETAETCYGVVIRDGVLDAEATAGLRRKRSSKNAGAALFAFGPEREAWERLMPDDRYHELLSALNSYPPAARFQRRKAFFSSLYPEFRDGRPVILADIAEDPEGRRFDTALALLKQ